MSLTAQMTSQSAQPLWQDSSFEPRPNPMLYNGFQWAGHPGTLGHTSPHPKLAHDQFICFCMVHQYNQHINTHI